MNKKDYEDFKKLRSVTPIAKKHLELLRYRHLKNHQSTGKDESLDKLVMHFLNEFSPGGVSDNNFFYLLMDYQLRHPEENVLVYVIEHLADYVRELNKLRAKNTLYAIPRYISLETIKSERKERLEKLREKENKRSAKKGK